MLEGNHRKGIITDIPFVAFTASANPVSYVLGTPTQYLYLLKSISLVLQGSVILLMTRMVKRPGHLHAGVHNNYHGRPEYLLMLLWHPRVPSKTLTTDILFEISLVDYDHQQHLCFMLDNYSMFFFLSKIRQIHMSKYMKIDNNDTS